MSARRNVGLAVLASVAAATAVTAYDVATQGPKRSEYRHILVSSQTFKTADGPGQVLVTFTKTVTNTGNVPFQGLIMQAPAAKAFQAPHTGLGVSCTLGAVNTPVSRVASVAPRGTAIILNGMLCTFDGGLPIGATARLSMGIVTGARQPLTAAQALRRGASVTIAPDGLSNP
jgi:hypothetical protein